MTGGLKVVSLKLPEAMLEALDKLVRQKKYSSRNEAIRIAIRDLLDKELEVD